MILIENIRSPIKVMVNLLRENVEKYHKNNY